MTNGQTLHTLSGSSQFPTKRWTLVIAAGDLHRKEASVPFYPPLARASPVQGTVTLAVTTNGDRVQSTRVENGQPLLSAAAESNIRTWTLVGKPSQTFAITYRYTLSDRCKGDPAVKIDFPTSVAICSKPDPPLD
jgi:hypothetical protein